MLTIISTLTFIGFGAIYPLYLWVVAKETMMDRGFHRFTLGLSSFIGGMGVTFFWLLDLDNHNRLAAVVWLISLVAVTKFYWNRNRIQAWVVTIPSILGAIVFTGLNTELVAPSFTLWLVSFMGGFILCGSIFAMILGHWYLNVINLPIRILQRTLRILLFFLGIRIVWDLIFILFGSVDFNGESIRLFHFLQTFNGFFLFVALLFGTVIPFILCLLTLRTVAIRSTQSATSLLYVVVISVVMGDLFYKYYLIQLGLFL